MRDFRFKLPLIAVLALVSAFAGADTPFAYWSFEGNANDSAGSANGTLNGTAGFAANTPSG